MTPRINEETWQIEADGQIYEAEFNELTSWVAEGSVLPEDKVRKGNLRWLAASKVPELHAYFREGLGSGNLTNTRKEFAEFDLSAHIERNGRTELDFAPPPEEDLSTSPVNVTDQYSDEQAAIAREKGYCTNHASEKARFICNVCGWPFCASCPNKFGSVRLCTQCGGMCVDPAEFNGEGRTRGSLNKPYVRKGLDTEDTNSASAKLGLRDLCDAFIFPFRFPGDLSLCTLLFVLFGIGQSLFLIGGIAPIAVAIVSGLFSVALSFAVLTKIFANVTQRVRTESFRPHFNKDAFRKNFLTPLSLGVAAFIVSFGLFASITTAAGAFAWYQFSNSLDTTESAMREERSGLDAKLKLAKIDGRSMAIEQVVEQRRRELIDSAFGRGVSVENQNLEKLINSFMRLSVVFLTPVLLVFLFGVVYFPAACSAAIKSCSFGQTLNLFNGLKEIKVLGFEYIKISLISFAFLSFIIASSLGVFSLFANISLPLEGAVSGLIVGGTLFSLCWLAFSYLLSITVHRRTVLALSAGSNLPD